MLQGASLTADQRITAGDMSEVADSKVVVITAGLRRKPDESRLDLINRNVDLFLGLLDQVKSAGLKDNAYLVVVSNPVDVLTYLAVQRSGLPWQRVLGLGTQLDTARFRGAITKTVRVTADDLAQTAVTLEMRAEVVTAIDILPTDNPVLRMAVGEGLKQRLAIAALGGREDRHAPSNRVVGQAARSRDRDILLHQTGVIRPGCRGR